MACVLGQVNEDVLLELHRRLLKLQGTEGWVNKRKRCCAQYFLELTASEVSSSFDAYISWLLQMRRPWDICEQTLREELACYADAHQPITLRSSASCPRDYYYIGKLLICLDEHEYPHNT